MKKRLTKVQKRMLILKDALAQIRTGFLKPRHQGICDVQTVNEADSADGKTLLRKLKRKRESCTVCARGAILLASVVRFNELTVRDFDNIMSNEGSFEEYSITDSYLMRLFSAKQLMMMETSFEGHHNECELGEEAHSECVNFYERYKTPRNRLIAILENTINNKGIFKP